MSTIINIDVDVVPNGKLCQCGGDPHPVPIDLGDYFADTVDAVTLQWS